MGTTGSSEKVAINNELPDIISRVREYATVPVAVGFGVATREHFNIVADAGADGVVIGSRLVSVIRDAPKDQIAECVEKYCHDVSVRDTPSSPPPLSQNSSLDPAAKAKSISEAGGAKIWLKREDL
jgi:tryptophan synthase